MANPGGGDLIIGGQPLDDFLRPLSVRLSEADRFKLLGLLGQYENSVPLTEAEFAFVMDKAKEIGLSLYRQQARQIVKRPRQAQRK